MTWVRFRHQGKTCFGTLTQSDIIVHDGEMFDGARPNGRQLALSDVELLAPTEPSKIVALWNNFHALAAKLNQPEPDFGISRAVSACRLSIGLIDAITDLLFHNIA
jgi:hypothetical protein